TSQGPYASRLVRTLRAWASPRADRNRRRARDPAERDGARVREAGRTAAPHASPRPAGIDAGRGLSATRTGLPGHSARRAADAPGGTRLARRLPVVIRGRFAVERRPDRRHARITPRRSVVCELRLRVCARDERVARRAHGDILEASIARRPHRVSDRFRGVAILDRSGAG